MKSRTKYFLCFFLAFSLFFGLPGTEKYDAAERYFYYFDDGVDYTSLKVYTADFYEEFTNLYFSIDSGQSDIEYGKYWVESDFFHTNPNIRFEFYFFFDDIIAEKGDSFALDFWFTLFSRDVGAVDNLALEYCWLEYMTPSGNWMVYSLGDIDGGNSSVNVHAEIDSAPNDISNLRVIIEADGLHLWEGGMFPDLLEAEYSWVTMSNAWDIEITGTRYDPFDSVVDVENEQVIIGNNIFETVQNILKYLSDLPANIGKAIGGFFKSLGDIFSSGFDNLLSSLPDDIEEALRSTLNGIGSGISKLQDRIDNLGTSFGSIISDLKGVLSGDFDNLGSILFNLPGRIGDSLSSYFSDTVTGFSVIGDSILVGVKDLFVPDKEYFSKAYESFASRVPFVGVIVEFNKFIWDTFSNFGDGYVPDPYVVSVDYMGKSMELTILDLSWYEPYKPTVDIFLSAFIIIGFVWQLFMHLPGIINGVNSDAVQGMAEIAKGDK